MIISCLLILLLILCHLFPKKIRTKVISRIKRAAVWVRGKLKKG